MALLYGRAGRLTINDGGFRPGQSEIEQRHSDRAARARSYFIEEWKYGGGADAAGGGGGGGKGDDDSMAELAECLMKEAAGGASVADSPMRGRLALRGAVHMQVTGPAEVSLAFETLQQSIATSQEGALIKPTPPPPRQVNSSTVADQRGVVGDRDADSGGPTSPSSPPGLAIA
jgi:hypothetical protein